MSTTIELQITNSEKDALISALPLLQHLRISNPIRANMLNQAAENALTKLKSEHFQFTPAEYDAIALSADAGITLCSGQNESFFDLRISILEWQRKLAPHYFALRKIAPILGESADALLR